MEVEEYSSKTLNNDVNLDVQPNPGYCPVTVSYVLKQGASVICRVYDASGRVVRDLISAYQTDAKQSVIWDRKDQNGHPVTAGVYFVRLQAGESVNQVKLVIVD
ncbi:MAG TPA: T9SS type A sorting domain-containing protein [bacterium]